MDREKSDFCSKKMQLLQERTPPQNPGMDEPLRRTSRRIKEKHNQQKNQLLSPKCLTFRSEGEHSRQGVKRRKSDSEEEKEDKKSRADCDYESLPGYREGMSEYQLERLENIRKNQTFLNSLKLNEITEALRPKSKPTQKGLKREKTEAEILPVRKSLRLQNKDPQTAKADTDLPTTNTPGYREGMSEYQLERLENIRKNQAFLSSLKLNEITETLRPKSKPTQKGLKREKSEAEILPVRKSLRLQNKDPQTAKAELDPSTTNEPDKTTKHTGPIPINPINFDGHVQLPDDLLNVWNEVPLKQKREISDLKKYQGMLKKLSIDDSRVVKVVKERILSAAFHPSSNLLMAAGDKVGHLGLWRPDAEWGDDGVVCFEPHSRGITGMAFTSHPCNLITVSYDCTARSMDLEKAVFDEVYRSTSGLKSFDFLSNDGSTLLFGEWNGDVAVVDRRTKKSYESLHALTAAPLRCVHVHPLQQNYFVVAESSFVNIYDLRRLKGRNSQAVCELYGHSLSVSSAFFSPFTGNRVLTTCMDDKIRVFNTSQMTGRIPRPQLISHNMHTGRWLSKLSAVWDPKHQECFVIGSMDRPRRIQVYHESGRLLHTLKNMEHLTTVCSITAFHPRRNALLGGNSSGRLHVFTD